MPLLPVASVTVPVADASAVVAVPALMVSAVPLLAPATSALSSPMTSCTAWLPRRAAPLMPRLKGVAWLMLMMVFAIALSPVGVTQQQNGRQGSGRPLCHRNYAQA